MKLRKLFLLVTAIAFAGCLTDSGQKAPDLWPVPALMFKNASVSGRSITIVVVFGVTSSGWVYSHTEQSRVGNTFSLRGFATPAQDASLPAMSVIEATVNVSVGTAGSYSFRFWQSDTTTLDTTFTVQ